MLEVTQRTLLRSQEVSGHVMLTVETIMMTGKETQVSLMSAILTVNTKFEAIKLSEEKKPYIKSTL